MIRFFIAFKYRTRNLGHEMTYNVVFSFYLQFKWITPKGSLRKVQLISFWKCMACIVMNVFLYISLRVYKPKFTVSEDYIMLLEIRLCIIHPRTIKSLDRCMLSNYPLHVYIPVVVWHYTWLIKPLNTFQIICCVAFLKFHEETVAFLNYFTVNF